MASVSPSPVVPNSLGEVLPVLKHLRPVEEQVGILAAPVGFLRGLGVGVRERKIRVRNENP